MQNLFEEAVSVQPWHVFVMVVATATPVIVFCGLFSFMGIGSLNFAFLKCFANFYKGTSLFAVAIMLGLAAGLKWPPPCLRTAPHLPPLDCL